MNHLQPDDIQGDGDLKIFAAPVCKIPEVKSNRLVYSNRRKSVRKVISKKCIRSWLSAIREAPSIHTLVDDDSVDNTVVNLEFHNFDQDECKDCNANVDIDIDMHHRNIQITMKTMIVSLPTMYHQQ